MKVRVRVITAPYATASTKSLQAILRNHAHNKLRVEVGTTQLYAIMEELATRMELSDYRYRTNEEAWDEFCNHYMPSEYSEERHKQMFVTPHAPTPSP